MAFAEIWEAFRWPDGAVTKTFTIITTNANAMMAELHNRMTVILGLQDWPTWFRGREGDLASLLLPVAEDEVKVWPVSRQVNSPRDNGGELLEAAG
jgi:putative SOS response-associated peptidase YedK